MLIKIFYVLSYFFIGVFLLLFVFIDVIYEYCKKVVDTNAQKAQDKEVE